MGFRGSRVQIPPSRLGLRLGGGLVALGFRTMKRAVILLSGGLDSATTLAIAKAEGFACYALSFRYGQRHEVELDAAARVAKHLGATEHRILDFDLRQFGGSALTSDIAVPKNRPLDDTFIGVNALDYSGYPDCRPEYIAAFQQMADLATKAGVEGGHLRIHTPLIHMTKAQIIEKGMELGVDVDMTVSCYDPSTAGEPCGRCDACRLREKGFAEYAARHAPNVV